MNIQIFNQIIIITSVFFSTVASSEYPGNQDETKEIKESSITVKSATVSKKSIDSAKKAFSQCCRSRKSSLLAPATNCTKDISNATPFKFNNLCMNLIDQIGSTNNLTSDEYQQYLLLKNAESGDIFNEVSGNASLCSASSGEVQAGSERRVIPDSGSSKYLSYCYSKDEYSNFRGKQIAEMSAGTYMEDVLKSKYPSDDSEMPSPLFKKDEKKAAYCHEKNMVYPQMDSELGKICITEEEADTLGSKMHSEQLQQEFEDMLNFCDGDCAVACEKKIQKVCSKMYPLIATSRYFHYNVCYDKSNRANCKNSCIDQSTSFKLLSCIKQ